MKKLQILTIALSLSVLALGCGRGGHTIISSSDGQNTTKIEYGGQMAFNTDNSISAMSPRSYLKYQHNDQTLEVNCDSYGKVAYQVNNTASVDSLDEDGKQLLTQAVKEILKTKQKR